MKEKILAKLEASRKDLLDFSTRNPLIHYRGSKVRGVHVVNEKPETVYDLPENNPSVWKGYSFSVTSLNQYETQR